jgi:MYND finger
MSACFVCKSTNSVRRCGKCRIAKYCTVKCQKDDWPNHKEACAAIVVKKEKLSPLVQKFIRVSISGWFSFVNGHMSGTNKVKYAFIAGAAQDYFVKVQEFIETKKDKYINEVFDSFKEAIETKELPCCFLPAIVQTTYKFLTEMFKLDWDFTEREGLLRRADTFVDQQWTKFGPKLMDLMIGTIGKCSGHKLVLTTKKPFPFF